MPEVQATLIQAFEAFQTFTDDKAGQKLRDRLPAKLFEPSHKEFKGSAVPANNDSKKTRKRRLEHIRRARQRLQWSHTRHEWLAQFITKPELLLEQEGTAAEDTWRQWCFTLECKKIDEAYAPVTKAEAYAVWANEGYCWQSFKGWWDQLPEPFGTPRAIDNESRSRITARLTALESGCRGRESRHDAN